ncbi:DNA (cytosine-5-)-methyltransferase [Clostridium botulinum]|uniref:DNA (cytosine-5-)-methyltransferase n=2 Tax=Clostridium botulinum TaxID=1491 RepID=A7GI92_CLOBL|nr:DNA (cytosine-5-)-methyltransferase [Clostridium botulinum]ABS42144.1 conserved domain protein [Clostridium botulinum F str. Langeland]KKM40637.1 DNA modification methylase [Clostridium botulinum]MBY6794396.1 DNA (cytosine-5-)-methyltransferase [Clostridium botulinum]MBY6938184.1 DNA (cytosine-5-)-methyltransferase [Clostridium botulinum]MBY6944915.1 DNA (cytosine-5-)-methyltransferase [Clostridium botulinum]
MSLTFIDFFAGVGGFRKGMEMADHKCVGHCEWDKFANMSYKEIHSPKEDEWFGTDIRNVKATELPRADCWCFGFPCQDISVAGEQGGIQGKRSSLFFTVTGLNEDTKKEDKPKYLFIENVKNLLSINRGFDFTRLLIEMDKIGYDAEWQVINSRDFGVPQNRERVFIIGHLRERSTRKIFPITGTSQSVGVSIKRIAHANNFRRYNQTYDVNSSVESLDTCQGGGRQPCVKVVENVNPSGKGMNGQVYDSEGLAATLTTNKGEGNKIFVRAVSAPNRYGVEIQGRIRKLTPKECWRLQGWPDEDFEKAAKVCSNSQLYKQAGNGVTVNVIYEIAKRMS